MPGFLTVLLWGPWVLLVAYLAFRLRMPHALPPARLDGGSPFVSVVIPARNEARNIRNCVASIARSEYPHFEMIVVNDRSDDDTAAVARSIDSGNARRILVIDGDELPEGWLGKPWACSQGAAEALGEYLLFTDADTTHGPDLMARAVTALDESETGALSLVGRQLTGSFWERLIQPHVFAALLLRFPDVRDPLRPERWRDAIANGQFMLFERSTYEAMGGHEAVKAEVVEDLRIGQLLVRDGLGISIRLAEDAFATRMYRSLPEIVEGWSKNVAVASRMAVDHRFAAIALPVTILMILFYWVMPPTVLAAGLFTTLSPLVFGWALASTAFGFVLWGAICVRFQISVAYALLFPFGSLASLLIFTRSLFRGNRVVWKGREYRVAVRPDPGNARDLEPDPPRGS